MRFSRIFTRLLFVVLLLSGSVICINAQASPTEAYFLTARQLREAAAQCPGRAACIIKYAEYNECLGRNSGDNSRCGSEPTCGNVTPQPPCNGGGNQTVMVRPNAASNSSDDAAERARQQQAETEQAQRDVGRVIDAQRRDRDVDRQQSDEWEATARLKPKSMNPAGNNGIDSLTSGSVDADIKDYEERTRRFGKALDALENDPVNQPIIYLLAQWRKIAEAAANKDASFAPSGKTDLSANAGNGNPLNPNNPNYSPKSNAQSDGWANNTDLTPDWYKNAPPITVIEFFPGGGSIVEEYEQKFFRSVEFPGGFQYPLVKRTEYNLPPKNAATNLPPDSKISDRSEKNPSPEIAVPLYNAPPGVKSKKSPSAPTTNDDDDDDDAVNTQVKTLAEKVKNWLENVRAANLNHPWTQKAIADFTTFYNRERQAWQRLRNLFNGNPPNSTPSPE